MQRPDRSQALAGGWRRWQTAISSWAGLGRLPRHPSRPDLETLRAAMRALRSELGPACSPRLAHAIDASQDIASLWHLRTPLMQALAGACGERAARERIAALDAGFLQVWPKAPVTRA